MRVLVLAAAIALAAAPAVARPWRDISGGAQLHYEVTTLHDVEHDPAARPSAQDLVLAGARLHGFVGGRRWGYHVGLDLAAGMTARHAGFAYDVALFPVGLALRFASTSFVSLGAGVGASGAVGTVDDALTLPLELRLEIGRGHRLLGRLRATYVQAAPTRRGGTSSVPVGDELEAMLALRLGDGYTDYGFPTGNGYYVGVTYREAQDARFVGVALGMSLDMATRTRR